MGYELVGQVWDEQAFYAYCQSIAAKLGWAQGVTLHHTAYPHLEMRPKGFTAKHMRNLYHYYAKQKGWSAGPHLFTDEDQIWGMSSLARRGVHAVAFNRSHIGIEALGDFDYKDDPRSGRGAQVWSMTFHATAAILKAMGKEPNNRTITFHREDPKTRKTCPGKKVSKEWVINNVRALMRGQNTSVAVAAQADPPETDKPNIPGWEEVVLMNGRWFVPVSRFVAFLKQKGSDPGDVTVEDGRLHLGGDMLEHYAYNREKCETWASAAEIMGLRT